MELTPEVAPLLDRRRYAIRLAFLLPVLIERMRTAGHQVDARVDVDVYVNGSPSSVTASFHFPNCRGNFHYIIELNPALQQLDIPPDAIGFMAIRTSVSSNGVLPPVLKTVGFWVSYRNADTYIVIPSNPQYNSSRVDYSRSSEARLIDYFGRILLTPQVGASVALVNPFPIVSHVQLELVPASDPSVAEAFEMQPRSVRWIDLDTLTPTPTAFDGTIRVVADNRVMWFVMFRDRERDLFYTADHAIPWINRQL